jgi:type VI secretion system protein VasG
MAEISRVAVFGKLNPLVYKAVEGATVFCKLRGNPYVELEHWIAQIVQNPDSDWHRIIQHYGLDVSVLAKDITAALDRLPRGATAISDISDSIDTAVREAWVFATLMYKDSSVRSGYILLAMLKTKSLRNALFAISRQFEKIKPDDLADDMPTIVKGSSEDGQAAATVPAPALRVKPVAPWRRRRWASRKR